MENRSNAGRNFGKTSFAICNCDKRVIHKKLILRHLQLLLNGTITQIAYEATAMKLAIQC